MDLLITAGVVVVNDGSALLVKRPADKKHFPGAWTFPGGKLEPGEVLVECAKRELREETGGDADGLEPMTFVDYRGPNGSFIGHLYSGKLTKAPEVGETVGWFKQEQIDKMEIAFGYESIMRKALRESA
jgi:8-oxo-dGTP diphosphatase